MRVGVNMVTVFVFIVQLFVPVTWASDIAPAADSKILVARVQHDFDSTLEIVQKVLQKNGFKVAHVQRCDGGLKEMGYETDKYRVVFFGRLSEVHEMSESHAELIPFMPFKLLIYAEGKQSVISILNPESLIDMVRDKSVITQLEEWHTQFVSVLDQIQRAE